MRIAICDDSQREQEQPFDIVFFDIYMPGENGVDIAGELQKVSPETGIVFVTSSLEFLSRLCTTWSNRSRQRGLWRPSAA